MVLKATVCPHCGKPWNPMTDDMVQLFNHAALHTWLARQAGFRGIFHGTVREVIPIEQREEWLRVWIMEEIADIERRMASMGDIDAGKMSR